MDTDKRNNARRYGASYSFLSRYGLFMSSFVVATLLSGWLLFLSERQGPVVIDSPVTSPTVGDTPQNDGDDAEDNSGMRDDTSPTLSGQQSGSILPPETKDNISRKQVELALDTALSDSLVRKEVSRVHTNQRTLVVELTYSTGTVNLPVSLSLNHTDGEQATISAIESSNSAVASLDNTLAELSTLPLQEWLTLVDDALARIATIRSQCTQIEETLSTFGDVTCDWSSLEVVIINGTYQRSYTFYHSNFALLRIESSDSDETQSLSGITNINTTSQTLGAAIERILQKRVNIQAPQESEEDELSLYSQQIAEALGVVPSSLQEKSGSYGVSFVVNDIAFFSIYEPQEEVFKWLLFADVLLNGKPLSIPQFELRISNTQAIDAFTNDTLNYLDGIRPGIRSAYEQNK